MKKLIIAIGILFLASCDNIITYDDKTIDKTVWIDSCQYTLTIINNNQTHRSTTDVDLKHSQYCVNPKHFKSK